MCCLLMAQLTVNFINNVNNINIYHVVVTKYPFTVLELILINEAIGKSGQQNRNKTINFKERNGIFVFSIHVILGFSGLFGKSVGVLIT